VVDARDPGLGPAGDIAVAVPLAPRRRTVLLAVRRLEPATVEVIATDLGMTPSGARQHVQALAAIGLVTAEPMARAPGGRGRPQLAYSLTETGEDALPKRYRDLSQELLGYLDDEDPGVLDRIFERRREARVANAEARLASEPDLAGKVAELAAILDEDGYLTSVAALAPGRFRVDEHNCAITAVARRYGQACTSELDFIRAVLPEAEVTRVHHMNAGDRSCAYEVVARDPSGRRRPSGSSSARS
jgi:DeoR family suf operon transcriptional repressor